LTAAYHGEVRLAQQLRQHAERVPYASSAATLAALAADEESHAASLRDAVARLGGAADPSGAGAPRGGRNYWERLTFDLEDLRAKSSRYRELAQHWDVDHPEAGALFARIAEADQAMLPVIADLIARSDPHAED
jgi:hypothetical protein